MELTRLYSNTQIDEEKTEIPEGLHTVPIFKTLPEFVEWKKSLPAAVLSLGFLVICEWSRDVWYVDSKEDLENCFLYRVDLKIVSVGITQAEDLYEKTVCTWEMPQLIRKSCYVLDYRSRREYEVYHEPDYPKRVYGVTVPAGSHCYKFRNRFLRDNFIRQLEEEYRTSYVVQLENGTCLAISDGCFKNGLCASTSIALGEDLWCKKSKVFIPSNSTKGVAISEVVGMTMAIKECLDSGALKIDCYYDNAEVEHWIHHEPQCTTVEVRQLLRLIREVRCAQVELEFYRIHKDFVEEPIRYIHGICDKTCIENIELPTAGRFSWR